MKNQAPAQPAPQRARTAGRDDAAAAPFVKWAGGKRALIPGIAAHFPGRVKRYWEPFVGGGAVFFSFADRIDQAVLSDSNEELIITYQAVQSRVEELIEALREHKRRHGEKRYYLSVRSHSPTDEMEIAARFIYLNRTCYNGLYRVNRQGKFNVPRGNYKNPDICNAERLRAAAEALAKADLRAGDFAGQAAPGKGDFIYCDPPYDDCFTSYQPGGFTAEDQRRLRDAAKKWSAAGASVVLSNSDTPHIRGLYGSRFRLHETTAPRPINSNGNGRGAVAELIITSHA